jgi:sarcosine oxidase, subunit delta
MLLVTCPYCGPRAESEFTCGGEAGIVRPLEPDALSDQEWGDYLFMRRNERGPQREQWVHSRGCRRWFVAERDTVTYEFRDPPAPGPD